MPGPGDPTYYTPPAPEDPFASFDASISYQRMIEQQRIAQYQQPVARAVALHPHHQRMVATMPRFQYGVQGGQPGYQRYQLMNQLSRQTFASHSALVAGEIAAWGPLSGMGAALGTMVGGPVGGTIGSFALPIAASAMTGGMINKALERRQQVANIALDLESNRTRIGLGNTRASDIMSLSGAIQGSMAGGGYFSPEKQMEIHKIALSEDLISARSGAITGFTQGSVQQYKKNFEELKETTKQVVELLQTTVEGGMSVMKELKSKGFKTMGDIRQQVIQAKAYGTLTGIGAQNMMLVGATGAQAVQGTGLTARTGAEMYQTGVAAVGTMAKYNPAFAQTVQMAGGVAQAGATIAGGTMNLLQSRIGMMTGAAIMNPNGTINNQQMMRLLRGEMGTGELVGRAADYGYNIGASGRVLHARRWQENVNRMIQKDPILGFQVAQAGFERWREGREGTREAQAQVYAQQMPGMNISQQNAFADFLSARNKGYQHLAGQQMVENIRATAPTSPRYVGMWERFKQRHISPIQRAMTPAGEAFVDVTSKAYDATTRAGRALSLAGQMFMRRQLGVLTGEDQAYGIRSEARWENYADVLNRTMYAGGPRTEIENAALRRATTADIAAVEGVGMDTDARSRIAMKNYGVNEMQMNRRVARTIRRDNVELMRRRLRTVIASDDPNAWKNLARDFGEGGVLETFGVRAGSAEWRRMNSTRQNAIDWATMTLNYLEKRTTSENQKFEGSKENYLTYLDSMKGSVEGRRQRQGAVRATQRAQEALFGIEKYGYTYGELRATLERGKPRGEYGVTEDVIRAYRAAPEEAREYIVRSALGQTKLAKLPSELGRSAADIKAEFRVAERNVITEAYGKKSFWQKIGVGRNVEHGGANILIKELGSRTALAKMYREYKEAKAGKGGTELSDWHSKYSGALKKLGEFDSNAYSKMFTNASDATFSAMENLEDKDLRATVADVRLRDIGHASKWAELVSSRIPEKDKQLTGKEQEALGYLITGGEKYKTKFQEIAGGSRAQMQKMLTSIQTKLAPVGLTTKGKTWGETSEILRSADMQRTILGQSIAEQQLESVQKKLDMYMGAEATKKGWEYVTKEGEKKSVSDKEMQMLIKASEREEDKLKAQIEKEGMRESSQGRGLSSSVTSPVLNYWNNRWSL